MIPLRSATSKMFNRRKQFSDILCITRRPASSAALMDCIPQRFSALKSPTCRLLFKDTTGSPTTTHPQSSLGYPTHNTTDRHTHNVWIWRHLESIQLVQRRRGTRWGNFYVLCYFRELNWHRREPEAEKRPPLLLSLNNAEGDKLKAKLEELLQKGCVCNIDEAKVSCWSELSMNIDARRVTDKAGIGHNHRSAA